MPYDSTLVDSLLVVVESYPWEELTRCLLCPETPINLRCAVADRMDDLALDVLHDYDAARDLAMKTSRLLLRSLEAASGKPNELFTPDDAAHFKSYAARLRQTLWALEDRLQRQAVDDWFTPGPFSSEVLLRVWEHLCTL